MTIIISALITVTMTQYSLQSQANKELIVQIITNLTNDFMTIFYVIIIVYCINGIIQKFSGSKYEYYLMIKNIIEEIEKKEKDEKKREYKKQIILKLQEMKNVLKENKKERNIVEKIINKFI